MDNKMIVQQGRIKYLDLIKAISIVLVVFCHRVFLNNNGIIDNVLMSLCWLAVPCFFMCTGAIYCNRSQNFNKWAKKILSTYIVLIVWKVVYLIFFLRVNHLDINFYNKIDLIKYIFFFGKISKIDDGFMWFMYAYLSVLICSPVFNSFFDSEKQSKKFLYVIICILVFFNFILNDINIIIELITKMLPKKSFNFDTIRTIYPFSNYGGMLACYLIGGLLYKHNLYQNIKVKKWVLVLFSIIGIILSTFALLCIKYYYTKSFRWGGVYLPTGYSTGMVLLLSVCFFVLCQGINVNDKVYKAISLVGQNTMGIYYLHILAIIVLNKTLFIHVHLNDGVGYNLLKTALAVGASLLITIFLKKIPIVRKIVM